MTTIIMGGQMISNANGTFRTNQNGEWEELVGDDVWLVCDLDSIFPAVDGSHYALDHAEPSTDYADQLTALLDYWRSTSNQ